MDSSLVRLLEDASPQRPLAPVTIVRHPVDHFFSEFVYKKHCLWRQQGLRANSTEHAPTALVTRSPRLSFDTKG